ncbi:class I SAM-dependent RNA methyltransferase [Kineococcus sp. NUM-3379]
MEGHRRDTGPDARRDTGPDARRDTGPDARRDTGRDPRRGAAQRHHRLELTFLPGLEDVVRAELATCPNAGVVRPVPGRPDAVVTSWSGPLRPALALRTVVAPFLVTRFAVPGPRALLDGAHFPRLLAAVRTARDLGPGPAPRTFRFDAAGRGSAVFRSLAAQVADAAHLRHDPEEGDVVLRVRPDAGGDGWEVLVRLGSRPLSARPWRRAGHPAAANATVAAAMTVLAGARPGDRVANLMCGSGTLLVERLLAGPARSAVAVDTDAGALAAAAENLAAAGLADRVRLLHGDVAEDGWTRHGPFDLLLADPPWGDKAGRDQDAEHVHRLLLRRAAGAAAPGARLVVLTHALRVMERCLREADDVWHLQEQLSVFHKGHHPRIYLLHRQDGPDRCTSR